MKKLLNKTLRTFTLYSLIVLAASIPVYYFVVDYIWLSELDEHNEIIAKKTESGLNNLQLSEMELSQSIALWNKIQPGTNIEKAIKQKHNVSNSITQPSYKSYTKSTNTGRFRGLKALIYINKVPYYLTVETNVEETEETVAAIALITLIFFLVLVLGFLILNNKLSQNLWKPFRDTLSKLKTFNLNNQATILFEKTDTVEFEELNIALGTLLEHTISAYKIQKEFTENASHELQTPLAIIKNKLDLLIQKETITSRQYQIIEEINAALTRITRINKNLLVLSKIENQQYNNNEMINFTESIQDCLSHLKEHSDHKKISIQTEIDPEIIVKGNPTLVEMLLNNLLLNAIRHNQHKGIITILLQKNHLIVSNSGQRALEDFKLFKRFANTATEHSGSGLGLAIIQQICHRHNWIVEYQFIKEKHQFEIQF